MANTTASQDSQFIKDVIDRTLLESSIDWINSNLDPDNVFDEEKLESWAENNGYVKEK